MLTLKKDIPVFIKPSRSSGKPILLHALFEEEKEKVYILKKERNRQMMNVKTNLNVSPLEFFGRKIDRKEFSYSFSPSTEKKFEEYGKLYKNSLPIEKREAKEVEKKVGKERGKRGKGKGCE